MRPLTRTRTNPVFYATDVRLRLADQPQRLERALSDPRSVDLVTWNVFASLDTHPDDDWLAYRLAALGGDGVRAPARMTLWTGRDREPLLAPSRGFVEHTRARMRAAGADESALADFTAPVEVPVRVDTPDVLVLVDTMLDSGAGRAGRDRVVELVDAGLEHARRLSVALAVAFVYTSGTPAAGELSSRLAALRAPRALAAALPWRTDVPPVLLRELSWHQLLRMWETETEQLDLDGQPVRRFLEYAHALGLR
jgi:hypothetical protein